MPFNFVIISPFLTSFLILAKKSEIVPIIALDVTVLLDSLQRVG